MKRSSRLSRRRVCFVTGTRAEFGLMQQALTHIASHPRLELQIVATGMHLDRAHGRSIDEIVAAGWNVDRTVPWKNAGVDRAALARQTGRATANLAVAIEDLDSEIVLVVGDRVEAFAAATAGHLLGKIVAHVHGGDRAQGQVDDSLRHAITKLAQVHFPATPQSARRLVRLGEESSRIFQVGSPAIDQITELGAPHNEIARSMPGLARGRFALLVLHPASPDDELEKKRARLVWRAVTQSGIPQAVIVYPNNDPGSAGIIQAWNSLDTNPHCFLHKNLSRRIYLGLLARCALLVGNSSSGIIEAASFGKRVIDIGPRQHGRERSRNVTWTDYQASDIRRRCRQIYNYGAPLHSTAANIYGQSDAGKRIAKSLADLDITPSVISKCITY